MKAFPIRQAKARRVLSHHGRLWTCAVLAAAAANALLSTHASAAPGASDSIPLIPQKQVIPAEHIPWGFVGWQGVALDGDTAMIGAPIAALAPNVYPGIVVVYERDALGVWSEAEVLVPADVDEVKGFGSSIDVEGNRALISAPTTGGTGVVFVYERDMTGAWTEVATIQPPTPVQNEGFGCHVDLQGDTAMVSPVFGTIGGLEDAGFVSVFERDAGGAWNFVQTIVPKEVTAYEYFGRDFKIVGDRLLVGAALRDHGDNNQGGAYIFERDAAGMWTEMSVLVPPDGTSNGFVGEYVGFDGTRAILSKRDDDYPVFDAGAAYVYELASGDGWSFAQKLHPCEATSSDEFSFQIDYDGNLLAIASRADSPAGPEQGLIRLFARDEAGEWIEVADLYAAAKGGFPKLDSGFAIQGTTVVATSVGPAAAIFYDLSNAPLLDTNPCPALVGDITKDGVVDGNDLMFLLYAWGPCFGPLETWKDLDGDGEVGPLDLSLLLANWSEVTP